jgi:hypothetical protein
VAYYLNYYLDALAELPTVSACMSECLTVWKVSKRECKMVDLAVSAVALAIFSRTQQHPPAAREAFLRYGRLLRVAQEQITQEEILRCDERGFDKVLLTVVLMAWYETTMHQPPNLKPNNSLSSLHSWSHHDGAMSILKVWNDKLGDNSPSNIIKQSRRGLLRSSLLRNRSLPNWVWDGSRFGEHGLDLGFDGIFVRLVNLRYAFKNHKQLNSADPVDLISQARELDKACREWAVQIPNEWSYEPYSIPNSWPKREFYSPFVYVYAHHGYAAVWIQYFAVRMLVNSTILRLLQLSRPPHLQAHDPTYRQQHLECTSNLQSMADSLASTIPFSLGRLIVVKSEGRASHRTLTLNLKEDVPPALALPTIWPISSALSLDGVEFSQQLWFCTQLAHLGHVLGDGALICGADLWTHE